MIRDKPYNVTGLKANNTIFIILEEQIEAGFYHSRFLSQNASKSVKVEIDEKYKYCLKITLR